MRHFVLVGLLLLLGLFTSRAYADTIRQESFEGCTGSGYSLQTGSFWGDTNDGVLCGNDDNGVRDFTFSFASGDVTGQQGTDYIGLEDIVGAAASNPGAGLANPNAVVLSSTSITGYSSLGISFLLAAPNGVAGRYEASPADYLQLQYSVDGGSFVTVASFRGGGPGLIGMLEDDDLDGSFTQTVSGLAMQRFTYTLDGRAGQGIVSGSSLVVRVVFSSDGAQEEMVFDDIIITGTPSVPTIDLTASSYQIGEDGTAIGGQATLTRSGSTTGTASINLTFSAGSATGGGVDFTSTTMSVSFGANVTSVPVTLPIIDDSIDENNETFTIALSADGSGTVAGTTTSATVTIVDDDTADVTVSESSVTVAEGGATSSYTVVLESQPTANVVIGLESTSDQVLLASGGGQASSSINLTFTSVNWSSPQTVTVSAVDDLDVEADPHGDTITHTATSGDANYDGFAIGAVTATIDDDDLCGDTVCNPTETTVTCPNDCGTSCGDSACNGAESTANCASDCGSSCGDTVCNGAESSVNCVDDCGSSCGDTVCNGAESTANCVNDCGSSCGDTVCNGAESTSNCADDCGSSCGDTACNGAESTSNCADDCGSACGDGAVNGNEVCESANLVGESCSSLSFDYGTLACANDCLSFDTSGCSTNSCGDGVVFGSEQCDDGINNSDGAPDACRTDCSLAACGDGVVDTGEACDGVDLVGEDCGSLGFESGTLGCALDCGAYDTSACVLAVPADDAGADGGGIDGGPVGNQTGVSSATTSEETTATTLDLTDAAVDVASTLVAVPDGGGSTGQGYTGSGSDSVPAGDVSSDVATIPGVDTSEVVTSEPTVTSGAISGAFTSENVFTSEALPTAGNTTVDVVSWGGGNSNGDAGTDAGATSDVVDTEEAMTTDDPGADSTVGHDSVGGGETTGGEQSTNGGPGLPGVDLDAGFDAGDGGFNVGGGGDGCDCRVGAAPRGGNAHLFGLALIALGIVRIRRRRQR